MFRRVTVNVQKPFVGNLQKAVTDMAIMTITIGPATAVS